MALRLSIAKSCREFASFLGVEFDFSQVAKVG